MRYQEKILCRKLTSPASTRRTEGGIDKNMKLNNIRLFVSDFDKCFRFYSEKLGLKVTWGKIGGDYASFDIGIESHDMVFSIFKSDLMAKEIGNLDKTLPSNNREKTVIVLKVNNVDKTYKY